MQIPGLYLTDNSHMNFVFIISALNILLIFVIANIHYDKKKYKIFLIISLVMLIIISFLNYKTIVNFLNVELGSSLYTFFTSSETFFGKNSPRSTGSSRTFLLIFIISILIFHKFFEKHDYLKIFFYNIIATLVLLFQSRTTIFLLIIFIILNYFFKKKFSISNFFKYLVFYLMFPICLLYLTLHIKYNIYNDDNSKKEMSFIERTNSLNKNFRRPIDPATFSSGRFKDWTSILEKIDGSMFYGYGSQGDRHLINQTASNGLIYAISSSGIIGLIFFILFSLNCLLKIFNNLILFKEPYSNKSYLSALVIFLILLRSLLESSYAVFGVDFIIIFTFINYLNKLKTK